MKLESLSKNEINPGGQPVWGTHMTYAVADVHGFTSWQHSPNCSPISQSPPVVWGTCLFLLNIDSLHGSHNCPPTCGCLGHLLRLSDAYGVIDVVSFWGLSCMDCRHVSPRYLHPAESINHVVDSDLVRGRLCVQLRHGEDPMHWQNHDPYRWYLQPSEVCA